MADNNRQVGIKCTYLSLDNKLYKAQIASMWQPDPTCSYCMLWAGDNSKEYTHRKKYANRY